MNIIRVPRAHEGLEPLLLDMTSLRQAELRQQEVAGTNSVRAPELLAVFNRAFLEARRYLARLQYEYDIAERQLSEARAVFLIDKLPELLAAKGLATARSPLGSEDLRQAFLDRDPDYKKYQNLLANIRCYMSLVEVLGDSFENSYNSVKKLVGSDSSSAYRPNPNLPQPSPIADVTPSDDFFGTPR